jgi:hypothetical protein
LKPCHEAGSRKTGRSRDQLSESDLLFTVAEVAVAFAGFSGLVTVVSARLRAGSTGDVERHMLYSMLLLSMLTIAFALFPYLPLRLGAADAASWQISSGAFFFAWLAYFVTSVIRGLRVTRAAGVAWPGRPLAAFNQVVHIAAGLSLGGGAIGLWGSATAGIYLCSLAAMLYMAGCVFVLLFTRLVRS